MLELPPAVILQSFTVQPSDRNRPGQLTQCSSQILVNRNVQSHHPLLDPGQITSHQVQWISPGFNETKRALCLSGSLGGVGGDSSVEMKREVGEDTGKLFSLLHMPSTASQLGMLRGVVIDSNGGPRSLS